MLAVRVWPAKDYTRITLESRDPVIYSHQSVHNPERLVVDLEGVELNDILQTLPTKITGQDPRTASPSILPTCPSSPARASKHG